ncbi:MAG: sigma 54-interacting transcriptional regulator [Gemmatimonadales bacterium]
MTVELHFGTSPRIERLLDRCDRYARARDPILIVGERGTGKTMLARRIHEGSGRAGQFVSKHLLSVHAELDRDELAGHARGAYTGALGHRKGLVEAAHGGTLFVDELGSATAGVQDLLIELLDTGGLRRLGEDRCRQVDVRLVTATNADLGALAATGAFRPDLLDRLGYLRLEVPPLRERRDEIILLAAGFVRDAVAWPQGSAPPRLSPEVQSALVSAAWPGNIRELKGACRMAALHAFPRRLIQLGDLPASLVASLGPEVRQEHDRSRAAIEAEHGPREWRTLEAHERRYLRAVLAAFPDIDSAAAVLGVARRTLYRRLEKHALPAPRRPS